MADSAAEWIVRLRDSVCPATAGYSESEYSRELFVLLGDDQQPWQGRLLRGLAGARPLAWSAVTLMLCQEGESEIAADVGRALGDGADRCEVRRLSMGRTIEGGGVARLVAGRRQRFPVLLLLDDFWLPPADAGRLVAELIGGRCPLVVAASTSAALMEAFGEAIAGAAAAGALEEAPAALRAPAGDLRCRALAPRGAFLAGSKAGGGGRVSFAAAVSRAAPADRALDAKSDAHLPSPLVRPQELPLATGRKQFAFLWGGAALPLPRRGQPGEPPDAKQMVLSALRERAGQREDWDAIIRGILLRRMDDAFVYRELHALCRSAAAASEAPPAAAPAAGAGGRRRQGCAAVGWR